MITQVLSMPQRWLINLIYIQEKKTYNFFVIFIFAAFVGTVRYMFELMFANRPLFSLNLGMVHIFVFYLHCIFIYTFILSIFIKDFEWKKSIHLVLIGVFLGIFPPVIDTFVYGIGNYRYGYVDNFMEDWRFLIFNEEAHVPFGEAVVLYLTIFFTAVVIYLKTNSLVRTALSVAVCYSFIFIYAAALPALANELANFMRNLDSTQLVSFPGVTMEEPVFRGLPNMFYISVFQLLLCVMLYFLLNPILLNKLVFRINHAIPVVLTCLLGYAVFHPLSAYSFLAAFLFLFASVITIFQNDFFDKDEDALDNRKPYLNIDDVRFFNVILLTLIALLACVGSYLAYVLLLFFLVSVIYNYDFYRGKKYFPANYKVEGVWGLSAYVGGVAMVMLDKYSMAGNMTLVSNPKALFGNGSLELGKLMSGELFDAGNLLMMFLVFGGWSIISLIKDYKDIESDLMVGNQTAYTLLKRKGKNYQMFHKRYVLFLSVMMLLPIAWFAMRDVSIIHVFALLLLSIIFYVVATRQASNVTVELSLGVVNLYLLNLVLAAHLSY